MHPVGELLKQTRTAKGISLEQAAMVTRIRRHYLEALERGEREALPSPVQGRGFLRLYAGYLGLPVEELVSDWEGRPRTTPPAPQNSASPSTPPVQSPAPLPSPPTTPLPSSHLKEREAASMSVEAEEAADELPPAPEPIGSQVILTQIGVTLRKQRERLGLSLDDVERHTHLRRRYLIALEAGRLDQLPSTVQSRGMLSNYAVFLNLDADTLLLQFAEALQTRRIERLPQSETEDTKKKAPKGAQPVSQFRRIFTPDLIFGAGLILVLFIFVVWTVSRITSAGTATAQATLPSVSDVLLITPSPSLDATQPILPLSSPPAATAALEATGGPGPAGPEVVENTSTQPIQPQSSPDAETGLPTATLGAINSDPLQLYIVAKQRAFLRVTIDGKIVYNGRLVPGNAYPFSGTKRIDILVSSAVAVQVYFNQNELKDLGGYGTVIDMSFTQEGVQTPTATLPPTATATPLVTPSPTGGTPSPSPTVTPLIP